MGFRNRMNCLNVTTSEYKYKAMIGVGGIGSGSFFAVKGNQTLGREESRNGRLLAYRDYCKLHIISHYVQTLLSKDFNTIPIGILGDDDVGKRLNKEMQEAGINLKYIRFSQKHKTLFSFCYIYPDGTGCNLTIEDSACSELTPQDIENAKDEFVKYKDKGIVLAVPEVPLAARMKLLEMGTEYQFFRAASFTTQEMKNLQNEFLKNIDFLALNFEEACASISFSSNDSKQSIIEKVIDKITGINPDIIVTITDGKNGSWLWDGNELNHKNIYETHVRATAGAGDAFISGVIVGIVTGMSISESHELGNLIAALSVQSPHTINKEISWNTLSQFTEKIKSPLTVSSHHL